MIDIIDEMLHAEYLPLLREGRRTHYIGSVDKSQRNNDNVWHLYEDEHREWVLFEQFGSGCVFNFVQHRVPYRDDPVFRFYFDGEESPRFEIRHSQFGEKRPFVEPLAGAFHGPRLPQFDGTSIRVVRSFVPMPFRTHCKITCSAKLDGPDPGGWGHVVYQTFSEDVPVSSFDPADNRYHTLEQIWNQKGRSPVRLEKRKVQRAQDIRLPAGAAVPILSMQEGGMLTSLNIRTSRFDRADLADLWIEAVWDGHGHNDLSLPFGCLFGNELGHHAVSYLFAGMDADGSYYCHYPMPFAHSAEILVRNRGGREILLEETRISSTDEFNGLLANNPWGYFRNSPYHGKSCPGHCDSIIGEVAKEKGRIVAAVVTGYPYDEGGRADCEGNVRLHFDGLRTPQILSDGSESYVCYGWGFCSPPQCNALTGYDGATYNSHRDWSMCRLSPYEGYPFFDAFRFGIESFAYNNELMFHSGTVLYYGADGSGMKLLAEYHSGNETLTAAFEGDDDDKRIAFRGDRAREIVVDVPLGESRALILRRVSDQATGRQMARVYIDGALCEKPWYVPDANPHLRWLEDEYVVPSAALAGKSAVKILIQPVACAGAVSFNQFGIKVYGVD